MYATYFDPMKLKCFTKLLEANEFLLTDNGEQGYLWVMAAKIKKASLSNSKKLFNYVCGYYHFQS